LTVGSAESKFAMLIAMDQRNKIKIHIYQKNLQLTAAAFDFFFQNNCSHFEYYYGLF